MTYTSYITVKHLKKGMDYEISSDLISNETSKIVAFLIKLRIISFNIEFVEDSNNPIRVHFNNAKNLEYFNKNYIMRK